MQQVISSKVPNLGTLPTSITSAAVNGAILPVKIETARRAIAACTDLAELLQYKVQAEGIAAAVRCIKEVGPEMIRQANEMVADAWRKGGELLAQYSNVHTMGKGIKGGAKGASITPPQASPRSKIANEFGLSKVEYTSMVRLAAAPVQQVYDAAQKTRNLQRAAARVPTVSDVYAPTRPKSYSDALRRIMGSNVGGLAMAHAHLKKVPLDEFKCLTPDERKIVKEKLVEMLELGDEMLQLCR